MALRVTPTWWKIQPEDRRIIQITNLPFSFRRRGRGMRSFQQHDWLLATDYWFLASDFWLRASGFGLLASVYWLLPTHLLTYSTIQLFVIHCNFPYANKALYRQQFSTMEIPPPCGRRDDRWCSHTFFPTHLLNHSTTQLFVIYCNSVVIQLLISKMKTEWREKRK